MPPLAAVLAQAPAGVGGGGGAARSWRPFLDPLDLHASWWAFLLPLSLGISMVYRAVRMRDLTGYWRQVLIMTAQIIVAMILLGAAAFVFVAYLMPLLVPMRD